MSSRKNYKNRYLSATQKSTSDLSAVQKPISHIEAIVAHGTAATVGYRHREGLSAIEGPTGTNRFDWAVGPS